MELPEGTRVVLRVDATASSRAYPAGTVGVVVAAPTDATHSYRVRFADGDEGNFGRRELARLADVKDASIGVGEAPLADHGLDRFVVLRAVVGSRAYGLSNDASDEDVRGIYLPPAQRTWSLFDAPEQLENTGTPQEPADEVFWELRKFLLLALKSNPNVLEVLATPLVVASTPLADELRAGRRAFYSKLAYQTYSGYVLSQFKRMRQRLDRGLEPKWKHAMHLLRLQIAGARLLETGDLEVTVEGEDRERLLEIRAGAWSLEQVDRWRGELSERFERAFAVTQLPERPDHAWAETFLARARRAAATDPRSSAAPWTPSRREAAEPAALESAGVDARARAALLETVRDFEAPLVFATVSGAHLYGFPSPDSDFDLRGAHVLPLNAFGGLRAPDETAESLGPSEGIELDLVSHDIAKFARMLLKRNGYVLEQLTSPLVVHTTDLHRELLDLVPRLLTVHHAHHYLGFGRTQWELFAKKPTVKALLYVHRALLTGVHLMRTGRVEADLLALLEHVNDREFESELRDLVERKRTGGEKDAVDPALAERFEPRYAALVGLLERERDATHLADEPSCRDEIAELVRAARPGA